MTKEIKQEIASELEVAYAADEVTVDIRQELTDVFAPATVLPASLPATTTEIRYIDAISAALDEEMQKWEKLVFMGQDIADYCGVFKLTEAFAEKYGNERVRNTPL